MAVGLLERKTCLLFTYAHSTRNVQISIILSSGRLQSVHHQQLDDKSLRFFAQVRKHALLKRHVVVPDV